MLNILSFLDAREICYLAMVNRRLYTFVCGAQQIWKSLVLQDFWLDFHTEFQKHFQQHLLNNFNTNELKAIIKNGFLFKKRIANKHSISTVLHHHTTSFEGHLGWVRCFALYSNYLLFSGFIFLKNKDKMNLTKNTITCFAFFFFLLHRIQRSLFENLGRQQWHAS